MNIKLFKLKYNWQKYILNFILKYFTKNYTLYNCYPTHINQTLGFKEINEPCEISVTFYSNKDDIEVK